MEPTRNVSSVLVGAFCFLGALIGGGYCMAALLRSSPALPEWFFAVLLIPFFLIPVIPFLLAVGAQRLTLQVIEVISPSDQNQRIGRYFGDN
jgi:hypothetical protein